jgi:hypothetical protein
MKLPRRLTPTELGAERRLTLRAWVMLVLPQAEIVEILQSAMPPTIGELVARARKRAAEHVGSCALCGQSLLIEPPRSGEKAGILPAETKPFTPNARAREENR